MDFDHGYCDEKDTARELLEAMRAHNLAINRLLREFDIPNKNFYTWVLGEAEPTQRQLEKMTKTKEFIMTSQRENLIKFEKRVSGRPSVV